MFARLSLFAAIVVIQAAVAFGQFEQNRYPSPGDSTGVPIREGKYVGWSCSMAHDPHGGTYMAWMEDRRDRQRHLVMARIGDHADTLWTRSVSTKVFADSTAMLVAVNDGCVVIWRFENVQGIAEVEWMAQKVSTEGVLQWNVPGMPDGSVQLGHQPIDYRYRNLEGMVVLPSTDNTVLAFWFSHDSHDAKLNYHGVRLMPDGSFAAGWDTTRTFLLTNEDVRTDPVYACADGFGGVWLEAGNQDDNGGSVKVQHVSADGQMIADTNGVQVGASGSTCVDEHLVLSPARHGGLFLISESSNQLMVTRLDSLGTPTWTTCATGVTMPQGVRAIQALGAGEDTVIVAWQGRGRSDLIGTYYYAAKITGQTAPVSVWPNAPVVVSQPVSDQLQGFALDSDGSNGMIMVWTASTPNAYDDDIFGQRVLSDGSLGWGPTPRLICGALSMQNYPAMVRQGDSLAILWFDHRTVNGGLFGTIWGVDGTPRMAPGDGVELVSTLQWYSQCDFSMVTSTDNKVFVAWTEPRTVGGRIYYSINDVATGARVNPSASGDAFTRDSVNLVVQTTDITGHGIPPILFPTQSNGIISAWSQQIVNAPSWTIRGQRIDGQGNRLWGEFGADVADVTSGWVRGATDGGDGACIVWSGYGYGFATVEMQHMSASGTELLGPYGAIVSDLGEQGGAPLPVYSSGHFYVAYQAVIGSSTEMVFEIRKLTTQGETIWSRVALDSVTITPNHTDLPSDMRVFAGPNGAVIIAWVETVPPWPDYVYRVWAQMYYPNGDRAWQRNGVLVSEQTTAYYAAAVSSSGLWVATSGWTDSTQSADMRLQLLNFDGSLRFPFEGLRPHVPNSDLGEIPRQGPKGIVAGAQGSCYLFFNQQFENLDPTFAMTDFATHVFPNGQFADSAIWRVGAAGNVTGVGMQRAIRAVCADSLHGAIALYTNTLPHFYGSGWGSLDTYIQRVWDNSTMGVKPVATRVLPQEFRLEQNYPNPFNATTTIRFALPHQTSVKLKIYDVLGREAITLTDGVLKAGTYDVRWDGRDAHSIEVSSGVYFYRIETDKNVVTRKLLMLK